jgi:thymidylate kinase
MHESRPVFVALEGLRGCGKSTVAPLLARSLQAELVPTFPAEYRQARAFLDWHSRNVDARAHLFASALMITAERVRAVMESGRSVVIDSYLQRTVATHLAYGSTVDLARSARIPIPITFRLECAPTARAARLNARDKPTTWWDELADQRADRIEREYASWPAHRIDTTDRTPAQTVAEILAHKEACSCGHAQLVGRDAQLLPPVPCRAA